MPVEHILMQSDSLHTLAEQYMNDPSRWLEIAEYNGLTEPYIVTDIVDKYSNFGSTYLKVTRATFSNDLELPAGWQFKTLPAILGGMVRYYEVSEDTLLPAGQSFGYVHVRCTVAGTFGNLPANSITEVSEVHADSDVRFTAITNEDAITNGRDYRVLTVGDSIYIPTEGTLYAIPKSMTSMTDLVGGEDLALYPPNGYGRSFEADSFGDLASISGLENIVQAINDRLTTEKGDLPLHPSYGTNIASIIGKPYMPYTKKMIELEIYEALSYEDRIENVRVTQVDVQGTTVKVEVYFNPANTTREASTNVTLNYSRGGVANV